MRLEEIQKSVNTPDIVGLEDILMQEYGFIRNEDLMKEPIPRILNLLKAISDRHKEEEKHVNKVRRKR